MISQTKTASRQLLTLLDFYMEKDRVQAILNLRTTFADALDAIERQPQDGQPWPRPFPELADRGYLWIKVHRYWFGYSLRKGYPIITNIFFDTDDIGGKTADEDEEIPIR